MKKLLFVPLFLALSWLGSCSFGFFRTPTPSEMIQQAHDALPSVPALPKITVPTFNPIKLPPQPKAPSAPHKRSPANSRVAPVPYIADDAAEPPPVTLGCIFPFSLIPGCYVQ